jgi:hypothetical protein
MLIQPTQKRDTDRPYQTQNLWQDESRFTPSIGCAACRDKSICGGLAVESALYDCLRLCCNNPSDCDTVCRNKPEEFAQRVREIEGFSFDNVPRAAILDEPLLPKVVPIIFHGNKRSAVFAGSGAVCLPLYRLIEARTGRSRYACVRGLTDTFGLKPGTKVMLTGTSTDPFLERWWSLGAGRIEVIRALKALNIILITTPNYSLFTDQPRWDDLHSMKRIALVHQEFLSEGMPAALHVNARTERDWERWRDFISERPEITHIAFEFATGAGWAGRVEWHAGQLVRLAENISRPLHLVVRGGTTILPQLVGAFTSVTCLETSTFVKTMRRKAATAAANGTIRWRHAPTEKTEALDKLLADNWPVVAESYEKSFSGVNQPRKVA